MNSQKKKRKKETTPKNFSAQQESFKNGDPLLLRCEAHRRIFFAQYCQTGNRLGTKSLSTQSAFPPAANFSSLLVTASESVELVQICFNMLAISVQSLHLLRALFSVLFFLPPKFTGGHHHPQPGVVLISALLVTLMACIMFLYLADTPITPLTCQLNNNHKLEIHSGLA